LQVFKYASLENRGRLVVEIHPVSPSRSTCMSLQSALEGLDKMMIK
jgi:hypothetical protein